MLSHEETYLNCVSRAADSLEIILSEMDVKTHGKFIQAFYNSFEDYTPNNPNKYLGSEKVQWEWAKYVDALDEAYNFLDPNNDAWFEYMEEFISDTFTKLRTVNPPF